MTRDDRFIDQLEDYLDAFDGETPLPDRVRDAVQVALPGTHQVRAWPTPIRRLWPSLRIADGLRLGVAAATILVAVLVGARLLNINDRGIAAVPTPVPASSAPSSATLSGTALNEAQYGSCGRGGQPISCLIPGTYTLAPDVTNVRVSLNVPSGWFEWDPGLGMEGLLVDRGSDAPGGSGWGLVFSSVGTVFRDPCDQTKGTFPIDATRSVDGLVVAMSSWPGFQAGAPRPISIGGAQGKQIEMTSTQTVGTCPVSALWKTPQGAFLDTYPIVAERAKAYTAQYLILDVGGGLLVIRTSDFPQPSPYEVSQGLQPDPTRHQADQQTLHAIVASIQIGERP